MWSLPAIAQTPPPGGGGGGGGGGGEWGSNWQVQEAVLDGQTEHFGWQPGPNGPEATYASYTWQQFQPAMAENATPADLPVRAHSHGTITVKIKWVSLSNPPDAVWIKLHAAAGCEFWVWDPAPSISLDNYVGSPMEEYPYGAYRDGNDGFKLNRGANNIYQKTITLDADCTASGPWQMVSAGCGADLQHPGQLVYQVCSMPFTVLASIIDQDTTFGSSTGNPYPVNGFHLDANLQPHAYPVLVQKRTQQQVTLWQMMRTEQWTPTKGVQYDTGGVDTQTTFNSQQFTASENGVAGYYTSVQYLDDKVYSRTYDVLWQATPEQPFAGKNGYAGSNTMFVSWGAPLGEVPTLKRVRWVVQAASGATTEETAADGVWTAIPTARGGHVNVVPFGQEWKLMDDDNSYEGECDEFARLMMRMMHTLGISASTSQVYASLDANVEVLEDPVLYNGKTYWLIMNFGGANPWNAYEGFCRTAGHCYAVWDKYKANSSFELYTILPFSQYWAETNNNVTPGYTDASGIYWLPIRSYLTPPVDKYHNP